MASLSDVKDRARALQQAVLTSTPPSLPFSDETSNAPLRFANFSAFDPLQLEAAVRLAARMQTAARRGAAIPLSDSDEAGIATALSQALDVAEEASRAASSGLVSHALSLFAAHDATGRKLQLPRPIETAAHLLAAKPRAPETFGAAGIEARLDYWREDLLANEHHTHWHVVYPFIGLLRDDAPPGLRARFEAEEPLSNFTDAELRALFRYQDRHGELFIYMHQQMLARYDAERLSAGLPVAAPLNDALAGSLIPEGFDPGEILVRFGFGARAPDRQLAPAHRQQITAWLAQLNSSIASGTFAGSGGGPAVPIGIDNLGTNLEAALHVFRGSTDRALYGELHNTGHMHIAALAPPTTTGVMASTVTAIRDPIFYRWHRLIDDCAFDWQERQPPLDFADRPGVRLAKGATAWASPAIILLRSAELPSTDPEDPRNDAAVNERFGGVHWATDFTSTSVGELTTSLRQVQVPIGTPEIPDPIQVAHLAHESFAFVVRVENPGSSAVAVALRVFIAPSTHASQRRYWIELDKFTARIEANTRKVLVRFDTQSEVAKKPVDLGPTQFLPAQAQDDLRCACGWPYPLLLPRGMSQGMEFRLIVVATDATVDGFASVKRCGSVSFCGARDRNYPDLREMGYPFNRRWTSSIEQAALFEPQLAARALKIRAV